MIWGGAGVEDVKERGGFANEQDRYFVVRGKASCAFEVEKYMAGFPRPRHTKAGLGARAIAGLTAGGKVTSDK